MSTMLQDTVNHRHMQNARKRLLDREKQNVGHNLQLARQAAADAEAIIAMIIERFTPSRVYQWGSLLRSGAFKPYSDIDIAVEGITHAERFFALLGQAQALTNFPLDLVQLEKIAPEYAEDIRTHGKLIYANK